MASGGVGKESPTLPQNWEKGERIGQGTFGKVYRVKDKDRDVDTDFVVKEIEVRDDGEHWEREMEKTKRQIEDLKKSIQHHSLVSVVGACTERNVLSVFSPFMPEETVAENIKRFGPLSEVLANSLTYQLIDGVSYLHSEGIVHQNIKCSNLFLMPGHYIKLADYGVSDLFESATDGKSAMLKSFNWMAPEVLCGDGREQKRTYADIWSIGCTVIEMITGKPPFPDLKMNQVICKYNQKETPEYTLPQGSSDALEEFLEKTLQMDPQNRPNASTLIEHDFPQGRQNPLPGKWVKGEMIGSGAFGSVYLLRDQERPNDKFFVVKEMKKIDAKGKKMFHCEADILKTVKHNNIVSLVGTHEEENTVSIILPYMPLGSLDHYIQNNGPIPEWKALYYLLQIVAGVCYLHSRKIIHRDIKGANILLVHAMWVKLADFGIAKVLETVYGTHTTQTGTHKWMAPEVMKGKHYGISADIWSAGCVLVEMLTGKPPFDGVEPVAVMYKIIQGVGPEYQLPESSSDRVKDVLKSTFEWDPLKRPTADSLWETLYYHLDCYPEYVEWEEKAIADDRRRAEASKK